MKERIYSGLQFFCKNNNKESVLEVLNEYKEQLDMLDILHNNGIFFKIAISHDNPSLVSILLNYMYDTKEINVDPKDNNTDQSIRYNELQKILRECKKEYNISSEIESIIEAFCHAYTKEEDSDLEQELGDIEDLMGFDFTKINPDQGVDHFDSNGHDLGVIGKVIDSH
jgi:hypothetical protein